MFIFDYHLLQNRFPLQLIQPEVLAKLVFYQAHSLLTQKRTRTTGYQ